MGFGNTSESDLYSEEKGEGVPILLIHPAGGTASTWGRATDYLAELGRVVTYDRRGYGRSPREIVRSVARHTADAAALLESLRAAPAVVVGISMGGLIAVDLATRRPDLVRSVVAHEAPWRPFRSAPTLSAVAPAAKMVALALRGRDSDAVEVFLRLAYSYRDGGSGWDTFPEKWRTAARDNAEPSLADLRIAMRGSPSQAEMAKVASPVLCTYGSRSVEGRARMVRSLARAIPTARALRVDGAGHAAAFEAPDNFVRIVSEAIGAG